MQVYTNVATKKHKSHKIENREVTSNQSTLFDVPFVPFVT